MSLVGIGKGKVDAGGVATRVRAGAWRDAFSVDAYVVVVVGGGDDGTGSEVRSVLSTHACTLAIAVVAAGANVLSVIAGRLGAVELAKASSVTIAIPPACRSRIRIAFARWILAGRNG